MNRRQFLSFTAALAMTNAVAATSQRPQQLFQHSLYAATDNVAGQHFISQLQLASGEKISRPIPFRAHDALPLGGDRVLAFGRRPDILCASVDMRSGESQLIEAGDGRHFYGHGCLSADGSVLFTTENDFDAARGVVGIRDAQSYELLGEYKSYGVGPHDIHLMPDGKTLVIANGGIETHPDFGRRKLNLKTMQPSLVYVDSESGGKVDEYRLLDHQLSIRHLALTAQGDVGVATQYQGDIYRKQPQTLVAWQASGGELDALTIAPEQIGGFRGYMADLAYADEAGVLAVTAPRGNRVTFWDVDSLRFISALELPEPSGIQYLAEQQVFVVSGAQGALYQVGVSGAAEQVAVLHQPEDTVWDNHLFSV